MLHIYQLPFLSRTKCPVLQRAPPDYQLGHHHVTAIWVSTIYYLNCDDFTYSRLILSGTTCCHSESHLPVLKWYTAGYISNACFLLEVKV